MSIEAIIALAGLGVTILGALIVTLVRVAVALQKLSDTTDRLISTLDDHDKRLDRVEEGVADHEGRIVAIETAHKVKGCV